jgi:bacterioferritin-associated ferredoxin
MFFGALMYVCLCKGITDSQIRDAVYDGANSLRDIRYQLGVAMQCGKCACLAKDVIKDTIEEINSYQSSLGYAVG